MLWERWGHREDWGGVREKRWVMRKRLDTREGDGDVGIVVCNEEVRQRGDLEGTGEIGV